MIKSNYKSIKAQGKEFKGNRGEWSEPYAILTLLAQGGAVNSFTNEFEEISSIINDGVEYKVGPVYITVREGTDQHQVKRSDLQKVAFDLINRLTTAPLDQGKIFYPDIENFLRNELNFKRLKTPATEYVDLQIQMKDEILNQSVKSGIRYNYIDKNGKKKSGVSTPPLTEGAFIDYVVKGLSWDKATKINELKYSGDRRLALLDSGASFSYLGFNNPRVQSNYAKVDPRMPDFLGALCLCKNTLEPRSSSNTTDILAILQRTNPLNFSKEEEYKELMRKYLYISGIEGVSSVKTAKNHIDSFIIITANGKVLLRMNKNYEDTADYFINSTKIDNKSKASIRPRDRVVVKKRGSKKDKEEEPDSYSDIKLLPLDKARTGMFVSFGFKVRFNHIESF